MSHHARERSYRVWTVVSIRMHNGTERFVPMHVDDAKQRKLMALVPESYHLDAVQAALSMKTVREVMDE